MTAWQCTGAVLGLVIAYMMLGTLFVECARFMFDRQPPRLMRLLILFLWPVLVPVGAVMLAAGKR